MDCSFRWPKGLTIKVLFHQMQGREQPHDVWGRSGPGIGASRYQGPEVGSCLVC